MRHSIKGEVSDYFKVMHKLNLQNWKNFVQHKKRYMYQHDMEWPLKRNTKVNWNFLAIKPSDNFPMLTQHNFMSRNCHIMHYTCK